MLARLFGQEQTKTYTLPDGRSVTIVYVDGHPLQATTYQGERCYAVRTRGDHDAYFGSGRNRILTTIALSDGVTLETLYVSDIDGFEEYAAELDRLGAWGRR